MIRLLFTMFILQALAVVMITVGTAGWDIATVLGSTWLAYLWGKRQGRRS